MPPMIRIWALGSDHGDDAVGWWIGQRLVDGEGLSDLVRFARTPWDLLDDWSEGCRLMIVDASSSGAVAGTILRLDQRNWQVVGDVRKSSHAGSIRDALQLASNLGHHWDRLVIFAIEIESCAPGSPMSESARLSAEQVTIEIASLVKQWQREGG